jgi:hypothetical protein
MVHIIYHQSDFDGIVSGLIIENHFRRELMQGDIQMHPWDYGCPVPKIPLEDEVYIVDLSIEQLMDHPNLTWIDHHKSAIEKYDSETCSLCKGKGEVFTGDWDCSLPTDKCPGCSGTGIQKRNIPGYRIDGVAACRLCYQWCLFGMGEETELLPNKEDYVSRKVHEPTAITYLGEYDVWDKRDPNAEFFNLGLKQQQHNIEKCLGNCTMWLSSTVAEGKAIFSYLASLYKDMISQRSYTMEWEGLKWIVLNNAFGNSQAFASADPESYDAMMLWRFDGNKFIYSLYGKPSEIYDLSVIAAKHGGGGHAHACGFTQDPKTDHQPVWLKGARYYAARGK